MTPRYVKSPRHRLPVTNLSHPNIPTTDTYRSAYLPISSGILLCWGRGIVSRVPFFRGTVKDSSCATLWGDGPGVGCGLGVLAWILADAQGVSASHQTGPVVSSQGSSSWLVLGVWVVPSLPMASLWSVPERRHHSPPPLRSSCLGLLSRPIPTVLGLPRWGRVIGPPPACSARFRGP